MTDPYFDAAYFDSAYFDTGVEVTVEVVSQGHSFHIFSFTSPYHNYDAQLSLRGMITRPFTKELALRGSVARKYRKTLNLSGEVDNPPIEEWFLLQELDLA